jgi:hypothetical protein
MRLLSFNPNAQRTQPKRLQTHASHLRIVASARPDTTSGRLLQFHFHGDPRPAA